MEIFSALLASDESFDVFFDLRLNKQLGNNLNAGDLRRHRADYDFIVLGLHILQPIDVQRYIRFSLSIRTWFMWPLYPCPYECDPLALR